LARRRKERVKLPSGREESSIPGVVLRRIEEVLRFGRPPHMPHEGLISPILVFVLALLSLPFGNLLFLRGGVYHTLHYLKWMWTLIPVGVMAVLVGVKLLVWPRRAGLRLDPMGVFFVAFSFYFLAQYLLMGVRSTSEYVKNLLFFAGLGASYFVYYMGFPDEWLDYPLRLFALGAAASVFMAELQFRGYATNLPFVMPYPAGQYLANTGQQNMFGLYLAMAFLGCVYLHFKVSQSIVKGERASRSAYFLNLAVMAVVGYGLLMTTSRSGMVASASGFVAFLALVFLKFRGAFRRLMVKEVSVVAALFVLAFGISFLLPDSRIGTTVAKWSEVEGIKEGLVVSGRLPIWATSWTMFTMKPLFGVGLAQYKTHYLEAQRLMFDRYGLEWKYTHWAHNEWLHWLCETGVVGGAALGLLLLYWFYRLLRYLFRDKEVSLQFCWAVGLIFLVAANAWFTRPFHRIENSIWLSLAFALTNRHLMPAFSLGDLSKRLLGLVFLGFGAFGLYVFVDSVPGERMLAQALTVQDFNRRYELLQRASRHLLVANEAHKEMADALFAMYEMIKDPAERSKLLPIAIEQVERYFWMEPDPQGLGRLVKLYRDAGNLDKVLRYARLFYPGMVAVQVPESTYRELISRGLAEVISGYVMPVSE